MLALVYYMHLVWLCLAATVATAAPRARPLARRQIEPASDQESTHFSVEVPIDHFQNDSRYAPHTTDFFDLKYKFDQTYYQPSGPVIVVIAGEVLVDSYDFETGIVKRLAQATHGLAVILGTRFYDDSQPFEDLSTAHLRFLTLEQQIADIAYFAQHVTFPGFAANLTSPKTPYILYGTSFSGSLSAFARIKYPDLFYGAISSSGLVTAHKEGWQYWEAIREYAPPECVDIHTKSVNIIDNILLTPFINQSAATLLRQTLNLTCVTDNDQLAIALSSDALWYWQSSGWYQAYENSTSPAFPYCTALTGSVVPDADAGDDDTGAEDDLSISHAAAATLSRAGGLNSSDKALLDGFINFLSFVKSHVGYEIRLGCATSSTTSNDSASVTPLNSDVAGYLNDYSFLQADSLSASWRGWKYQICTELGDTEDSYTPSDGALPMVSRAMTYASQRKICSVAFNFTGPADVQAVNQYGGYNISADRLAFIGGQEDPWRYVTVFANSSSNNVRAAADDYQGPPPAGRTSTTRQPYLLIEGGVHAWDLYISNPFGNASSEPQTPPSNVKKVQDAEVAFVQAWMKAWTAPP